MKSIFTPLAFVIAISTAHAQTDSTGKDKPDTIKVGGIIIINKKGNQPEGQSGQNGSTGITITTQKKPGKRLQTSWLNMDLGFSNYNDNTNYTLAAARDYARAIRPGEAAFTESDLRLRTGKSVNFNLWLVKQRYGITRDSKLYAKWGLMLETNNYRYETANSYNNDGRPFMFRDSVRFDKNKLALDYVTVPLMIGFTSNAFSDRAFSVSAGVSIGYLYSSRTKQVSDTRGKEKNKGNFDFEPWKFQYQAEIGLSAIKLYGTYSPRSMYSRGLDITPYNIGLRFEDFDF